MFVDRKYVRKSAGTDDRKEAIELATSLYDSIRTNQRLDISVHTDTFYACSQHVNGGWNPGQCGGVKAGHWGDGVPA
jgi:hypothetical protein